MSPDDVDRFISVELPDREDDTEGFRVVTEFMMHGPCGGAFPNAMCMRDRGTCKKMFPKEYCEATYFDKAGYAHYRRRDRQIEVQCNGVRLDNAYVVPYSGELCMRFYAHINVEYCGWTMLIKYLFKYVSKGTDRIIARVSRQIGDPNIDASVASTSAASLSTRVDEIKNFVDARYIGPHEACWRIFGFDIHSRESKVQLLDVHLENMQHISFRASQIVQSILNNPSARRTTLIEWLAFNEAYMIGRHLMYLQSPSECLWSKADREWSPRRNNRPSIRRLAYVHPTVGDLFYQRMLLCHQKGCRSFLGIRTVDGFTHATNREACEALGLLQDDQEWITAMQESCTTATSAKLCSLFAQILLFTDITSPITLWRMFWRQMSDDVPRILSEALGIRHIFVNDPELEGGVLYELQALLTIHGKSLRDYGQPNPPPGLLGLFKNRTVMEETCYNREEMEAESRSLIPELNHQQQQVFDAVIAGVHNRQQKLLFVYGHGGTRKTFLWKVVITTLRVDGRIVLAVGSSGVASLLFPAGRTTHSRFKIPLELADESVCAIKKYPVERATMQDRLDHLGRSANE